MDRTQISLTEEQAERLRRLARQRKIDVRPVDDALHRAAMVAYRDGGAASVSFVDRTSFAFMRAHGVGRAFAFDEDFQQNGFEIVSPETR